MEKYILAFDSFKGCMSAQEACHAAHEAIKETLPCAEVVELPLSDGGEGLVRSVMLALENHPEKALIPITFHAHDPLMNIIDATYAITPDGKTAYMEMAATSGLTLVPEHLRNPLLTTTYGVGEMILDATRRGCSEIIMGIGGSATCDGGKGMIDCIQEHGMSFDELPHIVVACDVSNPLFGENGAAYIFGPQKGATPEQVVILDERLKDFARKTEEAGIASPELSSYPGTGAAGGLGYSLMAYLKASLQSGIDIILDIIDFDHKIVDSTIVITGEGKSDEQTLMGKVPHGVLNRCRIFNKPVWLLSGSIEDNDSILSQNFNIVQSINEGDNRPINVLMQKEVATDNLKKCIIELISKH